MESRNSKNTFLECIYCYKKYDTHTIVPYIGECGHSFCKPCLDQWPCKPCGLGCPEVIADPQPNKTVIAILMRLEQIQADFKAVAVAVDRMIPENIKPKKEGFEEPTTSAQISEEIMFVCQICEFSGNLCVFVKGIPLNWTDRDVRSYFQQFGTIRTISFNPSVKDRYVENRGVAMIEFSSSVEADKVIREANGRQVGMRKVAVEYWVKRQNPYPDEAFRQLAETRMTHKPKQ